MSTTLTSEPRIAEAAQMAPPSRMGDAVFKWITLFMAASVAALIALVGWQMWKGSQLAVQKFGFGFLKRFVFRT